VLERYDVVAATAALEPTGRRSITYSPAAGATVILRERVRPPKPLAHAASTAESPA
jgi:hypothetical protein